jgi:hypothetical protein
VKAKARLIKKGKGDVDMDGSETPKKPGETGDVQPEEEKKDEEEKKEEEKKKEPEPEFEVKKNPSRVLLK